jgi:hypothetical protein
VETLQEFVGLDLSPEQGMLEDMRKTQDSATHSSQPRRSGQGIVVIEKPISIECIYCRSRIIHKEI